MGWATVLGLFFSPPAAGVLKQWNSLESGNFSDGTKWSPPGAPMSNDEVFIGFGGVTVTYANVTVSLASLDIAASNTIFRQDSGQLMTLSTTCDAFQSAGTFEQRGGTHEIVSLIVGEFSGNIGAYKLSGGELLSTNTAVGQSGRGIFQQTGGTHRTAGLTLGNFSGSSGTYTLSNGELQGASVDIGKGGNGTFTQTGGMVAPAAVRIGQAGTYTFSGGTLQSLVTNEGAFVLNGKRTLTGSFTQTSTGRLRIDLNSTSDFDGLRIFGDATLNGRITVSRGNFDPSIGTTFDILLANRISGFNVNLFELPQLPGSKEFRVRLVREGGADIVRLLVAPVNRIACSDTKALIQAIQFANTTAEAETITLNSQNQGNCTYTLTTAFNNPGNIQSGLPEITSEIMINGNGAAIERSSAAGTPGFRIFSVNKSGNLTLRHLIVRNGLVSIYGGCIANLGGKLTISHSALSNCSAGTAGGSISNDIGSEVKKGIITIEYSSIVNNRASFSGGGVSNEATMEIINTTIAQNISDDSGGIENFKGTVSITNSTIAKNKATRGSGGIGVYGTVNLQNTILSENTGGNCGTFSNIPIQITSLGHNLNHEIAQDTCRLNGMGDFISFTAGLDSFIDPGTPGGGRFPLREDSPAIDNGDNKPCPATDQLDRPRPVDGGGFQGDGTATCDIGAVEFYPNVNLAVDFAPVSEGQTTEDTAGCPSGFVGKFSFTARLKGETQDVPPLSDLFIEVETLTNGNLLHNAERGPGGVGAILTVPKTNQYSDGRLEKTEFVDVPFTICLKSFDQFEFFVNVFANVHIMN